MPKVGYITLTFEAAPEGKAYVSRCVELGVASCGDTIGDAIESVKDATLTYLNALEETGEQSRVFAERGIVIQRTRPRGSVQIDSALPLNAFLGKVVVPVAA